MCNLHAFFVCVRAFAHVVRLSCLGVVGIVLQLSVNRLSASQIALRLRASLDRRLLLGLVRVHCSIVAVHQSSDQLERPIQVLGRTLQGESDRPPIGVATHALLDDARSAVANLPHDVQQLGAADVGQMHLVHPLLACLVAPTEHDTVLTFELFKVHHRIQH